MANLQNLVKRITDLGISAKKVSDDTGISTGNLSDWKSGRSMPSASKLVILADYLDCSVDYLLGRTEIIKKAVLSENQAERLTDLYYRLNDEGKLRLLEQAEMLVSSGKYHLKNTDVSAV